MRFAHYILKPSCTPIQKPTMHGHLHIIHHSLFAHILCPHIYWGCFVALLQHHFQPFYVCFLGALQVSDRNKSVLHQSSLNFLVYCCFFHFSTHFPSGQVFTVSTHPYQVSSPFTSLDTLHTSHLRLLASSPSLWRHYMSLVSSKIPSQVSPNWTLDDLPCSSHCLPHPSSTCFS